MVIVAAASGREKRAKFSYLSDDYSKRKGYNENS